MKHDFYKLKLNTLLKRLHLRENCNKIVVNCIMVFKVPNFNYLIITKITVVFKYNIY